MATTKSTTKKSPNRSTQAAKATTAARKTGTQARQTGTQARKTAAHSQRTIGAFVRDGAYAGVGVADTAVSFARTLPDRAVEWRAKVTELTSTAPKRVRSLTGEAPAYLRDLRRQAEGELDAYAARGRQVWSSISRGAATKRALEQTKTARAQVKAAATSVRKAAGASVDALDVAADKVGDERA